MRGETWGRLSKVASRLFATTPRRAAVAIAVATGLTLLFYAASSHAFTGNSDGATVVLEGVALRDGHLTLSGWSLSLDSFWSVDALFYAVAVLIAGLHASYMHLIPAVLAALTVVVGACFAVEGLAHKGRIAAVAFVAIALALPAHALSFFFLQGPWHVGTVLYCLVAFAALVRGRFGWPFVVAVVLLAAGLLGDLQMLALGVIPVFLAGLLASARARSVRVGLPMLLAAPCSIVLAVLVRVVATAIGTYRVAESHHTVSMLQAESDVGHLINWGSALFGLHQSVFDGPTISRALEAPRAFVLLAVGAGLVLGIIAIARGVIVGGRRGVLDAAASTDDLLVLASFASVGVFVELTLSNNVSYARYLDAVVVFASLLGARAVGRLAERLGHLELGALVLVGLVVFGTSASVLAIDLDSALPRSPTHPLEAFLAEHDLHNGIGDYWAASVVTVDTRGTIRIRPVVANLQGQLVSDGRNASSHWYSGQKFGFLVYDRVPYGRVDAQTVQATFGTPMHTYQVGSYYIDVWSHPLRLGSATFP